MGLFQLDPASIESRVRDATSLVRIPNLSTSILRGALGFTVVSVAGFAPWALAGGWFYKNTGEIGLYASCAIVFILVSSPLMHRLIIGPGSFSRFYKIFGLSFFLHAAAWTAGYILVKRAAGMHAGSLTGLAAGAIVMGAILAFAFEAGFGAAIQSILAIFILNSVGYFAGGWFEQFPEALKELQRILPFEGATVRTLAKLLWGVTYGLGFGAGLGFAFYVCQVEVRRRLDFVKLS